MGNVVLFQEVQGSDNKSLEHFFKVTAGLVAAGLVFNLIKQKASVTNETLILFTGFFICIIVAVFATTKLVTEIRTDGVYVRFPPLQFSFSSYPWSSIKEIYLRKYDALFEYNGWGIKTGPMGRGYIVSGDTGIQLEFLDGTKVLITTKQPDAVAAVLRKLNS
jgi:hypothetical protein